MPSDLWSDYKRISQIESVNALTKRAVGLVGEGWPHTTNEWGVRLYEFIYLFNNVVRVRVLGEEGHK